MKKIDISSRMYPETFALVDDADFDWLNQWKWYADKGHNCLYAIRNIRINNRRSRELMHRLILNAKPGQEIDHADRNGLNCQRVNIRFCTRSQNTQNSEKIKNTSSKYKGVYWHKKDKKWRAVITVNSKRTYLGGYNSEAEAAKAYDEKVKIIYGEFASPNFPELLK